MNREVHVRFRESRGVRFPPATRLPERNVRLGRIGCSARSLHEADGAGGDRRSLVRSELDQGRRRSPALPQDRAGGIDALGSRKWAHADRHVGREGPHVGFLIEGNPRHDVNDKGQDARPDDPMVPRLLLRPELEDQALVLEPHRHPESAGERRPRTRYVGHVVS
jgi:hypothetical protein